jgi:hypothetical protein
MLYWVPTHGHIWEDSPYMGRLPIHGKSSYIYAYIYIYIYVYICIYLHMYVGSLHAYGQSSHVCEDLHEWEDFPYMGSLPKYPSIWGCIPRYWGTQIYGNAFSHSGIPNMLECVPTYWGTPIYGGCVPMHWGTPVYGNQKNHLFPDFCAHTLRYIVRSSVRNSGGEVLAELLLLLLVSALVLL